MLRHSLPLAVVALLFASLLASCGSDSSVTTTMPRTQRAPAATVVVVPDPTADLPPATAAAAPLVADGFVKAADAGQADVCSLYEPDQLAALLGEFWALEGGIAAEGRCIWPATSDHASGALISIAVADRTGEFLNNPDTGSYEFESDQGPAVAVAKADSVIIVNVTTNDPDVEVAALNEVEAERRISGDLDRRVAG